MDASLYLNDVLLHYRKCKHMAERAMGQVSDQDFFRSLDKNPNSIAHIVKHVAGNMRSRWRDFLTTDGEKPDRNRDTEFALTDADTRDALMQRWEASWQLALTEAAALSPADLDKDITIRREPYRVIEAINRNLLHCAYHVGQIVHLARYYAGEQWETLSVPLGQSAEMNRRMRESGGTSDRQKEDLA
ncbi:DUF1572 domain-containing protein [candidate division GN15 bacterium]|nr:DUF1572 domain-containing protein [candidate division GN15 bacterium]